MVRNEKAPTSAPTLARAEEKETVSSGTSSAKYLNMEAGGRQQGFVESILMREGARGASHAIRTVELVRIAGLSDTRTLQAEIERERAAGALILSRSGRPGGYFLPAVGAAGKYEIAVYVSTLRARALNTLRTIRTAKRALRVLDGQESLCDE